MKSGRLQLALALCALPLSAPAQPVSDPPGGSGTPAKTAHVSRADAAKTAILPAAEDASSVRVPKVSRPPRLEQFLTGTPREDEARITNFRQREPGDGKPVSQKTTAYLSYDDRNLYVVFVCQDEPGKVRARMAKREDTADDDQVSVYFDTFRDRQHAYLFAVNPLGIQTDAIFTEGEKKPDTTFDTLWYSEGRLTEDGYAVWIAIPFKSVRFARRDGQTWGIALGRAIQRNNENSFWPFVTLRKQGFLQQMAALEGLRDISAGRNVQLIPYGTFTNARLLDGNHPGLKTQNDGRAGLDSKVVLRDSLTLDVTLNPDFSQVESDDPQVTINQRYEVFFPEKRPFFIENASYFATPINLFFSRRIIDPEFGARLTGKLGPWALGVLATDDRAPGKLVSADDPLAGRRAAAGIARIQREFGNQSRIGLLASTREFGSSANHVASLDTRLRLNQNWFFMGQSAYSFDRDLKGNKRSGGASYAELLRTGRHFTYDATYNDLSPNFRADLGFIRRVDIRQTEHYLGYLWRPESSRVLDFGPNADFSVDWDHTGLMQDWYGNLGFSVDFTGPTGIRVFRSQSFERYLNQGFRYQKTGASFYTNYVQRLNFYGSFDQGTGINYQPGPGLQPFLGRATDASFGLTFRPKPRLRVDEIYYFTRFGTLGHDAVFNNHLARSKVNYQFTRALSLRAIIDYYGLLPNSNLISQYNFKQITGDILLTYLINPGTALYIGYNNRFENLAIDPDTPLSLRRFGAPNYLTGAQFFIKLSYLFRF